MPLKLWCALATVIPWNIFVLTTWAPIETRAGQAFIQIFIAEPSSPTFIAVTRVISYGWKQKYVLGTICSGFLILILHELWNFRKFILQYKFMINLAIKIEMT